MTRDKSSRADPSNVIAPPLNLLETSGTSNGTIYGAVVRSFRLYLYSHDLQIVGRSDFNAQGQLSALTIADGIFAACGDACGSYDLWDGPVRIPVSDARNRASALNEYEQQIMIDTEIALRDSWVRIRESRSLLAALEKLQQEPLAGRPD